MKTTVEIPDALFLQANLKAARSGTTLRALIEQGLKQIVEDGSQAPGHQPRDGRVNGKGLTPEARSAGWRVAIDASNDR